MNTPTINEIYTFETGSASELHKMKLKEKKAKEKQKKKNQFL